VQVAVLGLVVELPGEDGHQAARAFASA